MSAIRAYQARASRARDFEFGRFHRDSHCVVRGVRAQLARSKNSKHSRKVQGTFRKQILAVGSESHTRSISGEHWWACYMYAHLFSFGGRCLLVTLATYYKRY